MPTVIDIVLLVLLFFALMAGLRAGFFSTLGTFAGLIAGALAMPYVLPLVAQHVGSDTWRGAAVIGAAALLLSITSGIGSGIGHAFRRGADRLLLGPIERLLGGALALVGAAVALAFTATGVITAGIPVLSQLLASSTLLQTIDRYTPPVVDDAVARLRAHAFDDAVLPTIEGIFDGNTDDLGGQLADVQLDNPALQTAANSVARVSGLAPACGTMPSGSGFVVAEDLIVTNAHVVAGVPSPLVELPGEPARPGSIIYFDPVDDLAVISADVDAAPLALDDSLAAGSAAVVQGYPYGGPFQSVPARVLATGANIIPDIYGTSSAARSIHVLEAAVEPGNSGGPLLSEGGGVAGVIFARAENPGIGYAMTNEELYPILDGLSPVNAAVDSGSCLG
ncbi:MAG: MarP family serine protease [Ancrocorticia sp.]